MTDNFKGRVSAPPLKQNDGYGYQLAYQLAVKKLAEIEDIEQQCRHCGVRFLKAEKKISLDYLHRTYLIRYPEAEITLLDSEECVSLVDRILLLHYVTRARGTPLSGQLISFKELPEGTNYFPTFYKRAVRPLAIYFGGGPEKLLETGSLLGGRGAGYGDISVTIDALSRVPLTLVLWRGDAEFPAEASIMFDRTITDYLPTEDIIYLCQSASWRLVKLLKAGGDTTDRH